MASTTRRANEFERAAIDLVEAVLLADRIGAEFDAAVVEADSNDRAGKPGRWRSTTLRCGRDATGPVWSPALAYGSASPRPIRQPARFAS